VPLREYDIAIALLSGEPQPSQKLASALLNRAAVLHDLGNLDASISATLNEAMAQFQKPVATRTSEFSVLYNNMSMLQRNAGNSARGARADRDSRAPTKR
jgi:hypothetical protein